MSPNAYTEDQLVEQAARHFDGTIVAVEGLDSNETTS